MLKIPITIGIPGGYDEYFEEIFRLEEIENAYNKLSVQLTKQIKMHWNHI
jgi:hypothetical protein